MHRQVKSLVPIFGMVVAITLSSMFAIYWAGSKVSMMRARIMENREVLATVSSLAAVLKDAETWQQGFLITGDDAYLDPFHSAQRRLGGELHRLQNFARAGRVDTDLSTTVSKLAQDQSVALEQGIRTRREKGFEAGAALIRTQAGTGLSRSLRESLNRLEHQESRELASNQEKRDRFQTISVVLAAFMGAIELLFLLWAFRRIKEEIGRTEHERHTLAVTLASIGDGVIATDARGCVSFLNAEAEHLTGWAGEDARGQPLDVVYRIVRRNTGQPAGIAEETFLVSKDGTERPIDASPALIQEGRDSVQGMVLVFRDISDRCRTEEALQESEDRLRFALETSHTGAWEVNLEDESTRRSREHDRIFGYEKPVLHWTTQDFFNHILPEDRPIAEAAFQVAKTTGMVPDLECRIRRADGEVRWIWVAGRFRESVPGKPRRIAGIIQDITERKRAEEDLRESEERFRAMADGLPHMIWVSNVEGGLQFVNRAYREFFNLGNTPLEKVDWISLLHPDDAPGYLCAFQEASKDRAPFHAEVRVRRADGEWRWLESDGVARFAIDGAYLGYVGSSPDITERKRAEEDLRESEERFRAMADGLPHMVWVSGADGEIQFVNRAYRAFFAIGRGDSEALDWRSIIHPDDRRPYLTAYLAAVKAHIPFSGRVRARRADGEWRWLESYATPRFAPDGAYLGHVGISPDVTERKLAEEQLNDLTQRLSLHLAHSPLAVIEWGPDTRITRWSGEAERIFGWKAEEVLGKHIENYPTICPEDMPEVDNVIHDLLSGAEPYRISTNRNCRKDGSVIYCEWYNSALLDESGKVRSVMSLVLEVTQRQKAEEALRKSQERTETLAKMLDLSIQPFGVGYPDGRIGAFNKAFADLVGYSADELKSINWSTELTPPELLAADHEKIRMLMETDQPVRYEKELIRKDGRRVPVEMLVHLMRDAQGNPDYLYSFMLDITERKQHQQDLEDARTRAEQAMAAAEEASKAKDRFLAVLSHELRTPLTPVLAAVSMLQRQPNLDTSLRHTLEVVRRNVEVEALLIDDLLDLTRIAQGKVELDKHPADLLNIIWEAVEVCRPDLVARNIEFEMDAPDGPYPVEADTARLQQVFWNLLRNAVKFTPAGGRIAIRCRREGESGVVAEVSDNGEGIAPEVLPRLFNAFEQGEQGKHRQYGGLGLGLAISKSLVELHGGAIEAFSEGQGRGATFRIRLPLLGSTVVGTRQDIEPGHAPEPEHRSLQLLLVEDHGDTAALMKELLEMEGYRVETAGDVASALDLVLRNHFDLLISDLGLPDGTGYDLMRLLHERGRALPSIALSGYGQDIDIQRSRAAGFVSHVTKPVSVEELLAAIDHVASTAT